MLRGREYSDALVLLCRICGQCGATHSTAAAAAIAKAFDTSAPPNGILSRNVIQAVETILSHLASFYRSFVVDFAGPPYNLGGRFAPLHGRSFRKAFAAHNELLALLGLFAGKWPNTLAIQAGGVTRAVSTGELIRARAVLAQFRQFIEQDLLGSSIESWLGNTNMAEVERWMAKGERERSDLDVFILTALKAGLDRIGQGPSRFLSVGGFPMPNGETWMRPGYFDGNVHPVSIDQITEDISRSWLSGKTAVTQPEAGETRPAPQKEEGYSWIKAPRYGGRSVEVGPMARMVIDGDPLAVDLFKRMGPTVFPRVLMRLHEVIRLTQDLDSWLGQIDPDEPFYVRENPVDAAEGFGLVEAPRGTLGHWIRIEDERIKHYQIITPTSWNFSPRDADGAPGPAEEALVGTPAQAGKNDPAIAHVVRSFDPCLYCSVH